MPDTPLADFLLTRPPWFVIGALLGFTVVGVLATLNQQLGALGGYSAVFERASGRTAALGWRAWFLVGIFARRPGLPAARRGSRTPVTATAG